MKIERLGGTGSDYAAFLQHVGIPAADMSFGEGTTFPYIRFYLFRLQIMHLIYIYCIYVTWMCL